MVNVFSGSIYSIFVVVLIAGALSFFNPRVLFVFPTKIGFVGKYTERNITKSLLYSSFISIWFMIALLILGITSIKIPIIAKWLYLSFCIVIMREGMQMLGTVKLVSLFSIVPNNKNRFKSALLIGILGGFLSFPIIMHIFKMALGFMVKTKLLGILLFIGYAIGQSVLLLSLELLVAVAQNNSLDSNTKNAKSRNKFIKILPGMVFIFIGFIMSYFGFSYDLYK